MSESLECPDDLDDTKLTDKLWTHNHRHNELPHERPEFHIVLDHAVSNPSWIWPGRIPKDSVSVIAGFPGVGKSFLAADIAARFTGGLPWPDEPGGLSPASRRAGPVACGPNREPASSPVAGAVQIPPICRDRRALIVSTEDDVHSSVIDRIGLAGGDYEQVATIDRIVASDVRAFDFEHDESERGLTLDRDLHHIERVVNVWNHTRLLIIDPLVSHGEGAETETSLRRLLTDLIRIAKDNGVAILCIAHLRHDPARTNIYKALGSRALATIPRAIWTVQADPARPNRRLFLPLKMNLGEIPPGLAFGFDKGRIVWEPDPVCRMASDPGRANFETADNL